MKNFINRLLKFTKSNLIFIILFFGGILIDQMSKVFFEGKFIPVWQGVFSFTSSHNTGAGFSILENKVWLLILLSFVFLAFLCVFDYFQKNKSNLYKISMCLIFSGAFGNLIDRIFLGYVRDFLYVELINFPIFNVADSFLTIGVILLCIFLLFGDKNKSAIKKEHNVQQGAVETHINDDMQNNQTKIKQTDGEIEQTNSKIENSDSKTEQSDKKAEQNSDKKE